MLTRLHVQGYKALRDIDTSLEPLTVIVGPNGCGKTSVLEALALVRDFVAQTLTGSQDHPLTEIRTKDFASEIPTSIELRATLGMKQREQIGEIVLKEMAKALQGVEMPNDLVVEDEPKAPSTADLGGRELRLELSHRPDRASWSVSGVFPWAYGHALQDELFDSCFGRIRRLELDARMISQPSYSPDPVPKVSNDGTGLATVLAWLQGEQYEKFEEIQARLREFVPQIERIRTRRAPVSLVEAQEVPVGLDREGKDVLATRHYQRNVIGSEIVFDYSHARGVQAKHASEGTLLLLALLTVVATEDISVLLLDDIDRALHPKAQQQLVDYLRVISERGIQTIATTHSPYLVLHLEYDEVRAMTLSDSGAALIGKLTEHPEYPRWNEHMSTSEFWTVFGEEWLAKARAHG